MFSIKEVFLLFYFLIACLFPPTGVLVLFKLNLIHLFVIYILISDRHLARLPTQPYVLKTVLGIVTLSIFSISFLDFFSVYNHYQDIDNKIAFLVETAE